MTAKNQDAPHDTENQQRISGVIARVLSLQGER